MHDIIHMKTKVHNFSANHEDCLLSFKENIHVLPEKLCDKYLEYSLEQKPEVKESQEKE